jgi:hypothetical protein
MLRLSAQLLSMHADLQLQGTLGPCNIMGFACRQAQGASGFDKSSTPIRAANLGWASRQTWSSGKQLGLMPKLCLERLCQRVEPFIRIPCSHRTTS